MSVSAEPLTIPKGQVGRPRNAALDDAILQAVRELLVERGYNALSVQEVTRRCGVHVRTITRRWDSKPSLVAAAILKGDDPLPSLKNVRSLPTGRLHADIHRVIELNLLYQSHPATRAALPALLSEIPNNPEVRERFQHRYEEFRDMIQSILESAVESGDAPPQILKRARLVPNIVAGSTLNLQSMHETLVDAAVIDELTDFIVAALLGGKAGSRGAGSAAASRRRVPEAG